MYGGAALNAVHVLMRCLSAVLAGDERPAARAAAAGDRRRRPRRSSRAGRRCRPGADELALAGARPLDPDAADAVQHPHARRAVRRRERDHRRQAGRPEHDALRPRGRRGDDPPRAGSAGGRDRRRGGEAHARRRARPAPTSRSSGRACPPGSCAPTRRAIKLCAGRVRAGARRAAAARPLGRHAPDRARARRQGDPDDHHRLRHARVERPLAERADPLPLLRAGHRHGRGALHRARQALHRAGAEGACECVVLAVQPRVAELAHRVDDRQSDWPFAVSSYSTRGGDSA